MMNLFSTSIRIVSVFFLLNACFAANAQTNTYSVKDWWKPASPKFSPVVDSLGNITFRVKAKNAQSVSVVFGEWEVRQHQMTKDSAGVWSVTIGPVEPGIHAYTFSIDGVRTIDFVNPAVKAGTEVYSNIVDVPGRPAPRFDELQNVPHGTLVTLRYTSTPLKRPRSLRVFLPPGYENDRNKAYPVLYLRHGGGDDETSWTQQSGAADIILENLLAAKQAVPMIVVMPNGLTDGSWAGGSTKEGMEQLEEELLKDIIPMIEKQYRVKKGKDARAIAGLSMGGGQAYIMGLRHPELFSWIGEFSAGLLSDKDFDINERVPGVFNNPSAVNAKLKLLFIGCGTDDPRLPGHLQLTQLLERIGIKHEVYNIPGGHEWKVWREHLRSFMTKIFK